MQRFRWFLLNEENAQFGHRVGGVLTAVQDLENDLGGMGMRQITRECEAVVNQLRKILHSDWSGKQVKHLKELQKIAVALMKAIEEKDDLKEIVPVVSQKLADISGKLGSKVNALQVPEEPAVPGVQPSMQLTGNGPAPPNPGPSPQPAPPMPQMPM